MTPISMVSIATKTLHPLPRANGSPTQRSTLRLAPDIALRTSVPKTSTIGPRSTIISTGSTLNHLSNPAGLPLRSTTTLLSTPRGEGSVTRTCFRRSKGLQTDPPRRSLHPLLRLPSPPLLHRVTYSKSCLSIKLECGDELKAKYALVAVSVGVLHHPEDVKFESALPGWKREAIDTMEGGYLYQDFLVVGEKFWDDHEFLDHPRFSLGSGIISSLSPASASKTSPTSKSSTKSWTSSRTCTPAKISHVRITCTSAVGSTKSRLMGRSSIGLSRFFGSVSLRHEASI